MGTLVGSVFGDQSQQSNDCRLQLGERNLIEMLNYCVNMRTCRHALIERHFQEQQLPDRCDNYCDK